VAVEQKIVNPGGNQSLSAIPTDLPEGWEFDKVFDEMKSMKMASLPQTASNMPMAALAGLVLLLAGFMLVFLRSLKLKPVEIAALHRNVKR